MRVSVGDRSADGRYSWFVILVSTVAMVFTFGTPFSYGIFLASFSEAFGTSKVALSPVFSVQLFLFYVGAGVIGVFATRLPIRTVLLAAGGISVLLSPALLVVNSLVGLFILFALVGTTVGTVFVVLTSIAPLWFDERRGTATGVLFVGAGLSLFILPPAWQFAFHWLGIRYGFLLVVLVSGLTFAAAGLVCHRPPWLERESVSVRELKDWLVRLSRTRRFQLTFLGIGLLWGWYYALSAYAIDLFSARGLTEASASLLFGLIGGISIISRVSCGAIADRWGYRRTFLYSILAATIGSVALYLPAVSMTVLAVCFFGISLGGVSTLYVPVLLQMFGQAKDTAVIGVFSIAMGVFAVVIPTVSTVSVARSGSFTPVITLTLLITLASYVTLHRGIRLG